MSDRSILLAAVILLGAGCGGGAMVGGYGACGVSCGPGLVCDQSSGRCVIDTSVGGGAGGGNLGGGAGGGGGAVVADLPCDVASVLTDSCVSCHGQPLSGSATVRLMSRGDLIAPSYVDAAQSLGQRSVVRMRMAAGAMPPAPGSPVAPSRITAFETWVTSGMPAGTCTTSMPDGGSDGGVLPPYDGGIAGLPCNVATFVGSKCASCHRPGGGTSGVNLLSRNDFLAMSPTYPTQTVGYRSSQRIHDTTAAMPPAGNPAPTSAETTAFDNWVAGGMVQGTCGAVDAGSPDAGPAPTTCATNSYWVFGDSESPDMNPGKPCLQCHSSRASSKAYPFSGTLYPALHEKNLCNSHPPTNVRIEIIDHNGNVALTLYPSGSSGNFHSSRTVSVATPYTARVVNGTSVATMTTPQTSGDCNLCHTEQGVNGANGRLVWP